MNDIHYRNPGDAFLRSIDIHTLLPQQEPFVMVGCLTHFTLMHFTSETLISGDNIFVDGGKLSATGLIENIAQTCAARIGYVNKYILKKGIQLGFIGGIRNLQVFGLPEVGETITTDVEVQEEVFGMNLARAEITCGDRLLVTTEIKIAIKEDGTEGK